MHYYVVIIYITVGAFEIGGISDKNYFTVWGLRFGMNKKNCLYWVSAMAAHADARKKACIPVRSTSPSPVMYEGNSKINFRLAG
jgi:hypothetical protein